MIKIPKKEFKVQNCPEAAIHKITKNPALTVLLNRMYVRMHYNNSKYGCLGIMDTETDESMWVSMTHTQWAYDTGFSKPQLKKLFRKAKILGYIKTKEFTTEQGGRFCRYKLSDNFMEKIEEWFQKMLLTDTEVGCSGDTYPPWGKGQHRYPTEGGKVPTGCLQEDSTSEVYNRRGVARPADRVQTSELRSKEKDSRDEINLNLVPSIHSVESSKSSAEFSRAKSCTNKMKGSDMREPPKSKFTPRAGGKTFEEVQATDAAKPVLTSFKTKTEFYRFWQSQFKENFPDGVSPPWTDKETATAWSGILKLREMGLDPAALCGLLFREWPDFVDYAKDQGVYQLKNADSPLPSMLTYPGFLKALAQFHRDDVQHVAKSKSTLPSGVFTLKDLQRMNEKESKKNG